MPPQRGLVGCVQVWRCDKGGGGGGQRPAIVVLVAKVHTTMHV